MKVFLITLLTIFSFFQMSNGSALANQVLLSDLAAKAWTEVEDQKKHIHIRICFRSTAVNNKKQKSNCLRLKSSMKGIEKNENIIFETKNTQFKFKTNDRSESGTNMKFWLRENSNRDTINYYAFLNQLNNEDNALVGAMCKKVANMSWLKSTVKKAVNSSNQVNTTIFKQFEIEGYRDINKIAKRCYSIIENRNGDIKFVKFKQFKKKKTSKCRYSKKVIFDMQDTLKDLQLYTSKIDGKYGPGTEKAIAQSKPLIFHFANKVSECLGPIELKWLQLLASVKKRGQSCKKFNSYLELKDIAILLEKSGRPVFAPFSAVNKRMYSDYDYLEVVYAIINYENALPEKFFKIGQRARDCRLIPIEKVSLAKQVDQLFGTGEEKRKADVDKSRELAKEVEERASRLEAKPKLDIYDPSKYKKKDEPYDPNELGPIDKPKSPPRASRLEAKLKEQAARKADVDKARELAKEAEERASRLEAKLKEQAARKADVDKARELAKEAEERASRLEAKLEEQAKKEKNEQQKLFEKLQREQEIKLAAEKKRIEEESRKKEDERIKKLTEKKTAELKEIQEKELKRIEKLKETELLAERKKIKELEEQLALLNKKQKEKNKLVTKQSAKTIPVEWQAYSSDMSLQQKQFCSLTERFFEDMDNAQKTENQIRVNMVHKERQENFDGLLPNGVINNWIFRVVKIEQVEDGSAAVVLELQCKAFVGSGQIYSSKKSWNAKEKKEWRATIPYEDRRFRELAKLAKGQFVLASGVLLEIDAFKPGQVETFYASQSLGEHPLTKGLNLKGELFVADLKYIAAID